MELPGIEAGLPRKIGSAQVAGFLHWVENYTLSQGYSGFPPFLSLFQLASRSFGGILSSQHFPITHLESPMKLTKTKLAAASFGAALTTLHAAPELNADIVDLTFSPGSVAWSLTAVQPVVIDQLGFGFSQWNDSIGKTVSDGALSSVLSVAYGDVLTSGFNGFSSVIFTESQTGTVFVGFVAGGNRGWFSANLGGFGNAITFLDGQFGDEGEDVTVGGTPVPEPSGIGLAALAVGAVALRRRRKIS